MQHRHFAERLKAALENGTPAPASTIIAGEVPDYAEDSLLAAHDTANELNDAADEGEELETAKVQLEGIMLALESSPNGLTQQEARFTSVALEAIAGKWGVNSSIMPSMESFAGPTSRRHATTSLEANVKEVTKQIAHYLKEHWEKFKTLTIRFYLHMGTSAEGLRKKVEHLRSAAEGIHGDPKEAEINIAAVSGRLTWHNGLPTPIDLAAWATIPEKTAAAEKTGSNSAAFHEISIRLLKATDATVEEDTKAVDEYVVNLWKNSSLFTEDGGKATAEFPGGVIFVKHGEADKGRVSIQIEHAKESKHESKMKTLSKKEIIEALATIEKFIDAFKGSQSQFEESKSMMKAVDEFLGTLSNVNESTTEATGLKIGTLGGRLLESSRTHLKMYADMNYTTLRAFAAYAVVCQKSIAAHKVERKAEGVDADKDTGKEAPKAATEDAAVQPNQVPNKDNLATVPPEQHPMEEKPFSITRPVASQLPLRRTGKA